MANLLLNAVYTTPVNIRDTTTDANIQALTDDEINVLITQAQYIIDAYIICFGVPFVENQEFVFPVNVDDVETLPTDIEVATFYVVERLFSLWSLSGTSNGSILEESILSRTVKYKYVSSSEFDNYIPEIAQQILYHYKFISSDVVI